MLRQLLLIPFLTIPGGATLAKTEPPAPATPPMDWNKAVDNFAHKMARKHGWDSRKLIQQLHKARYQKSIIDAMNRPAEGMPWHGYRKIFIKPKRIEGGVRFWRENHALLERAEKKWGVPPQIITAIIGVETYYGDNAGKYRVLDALGTLAFAYPKRATFFAKQLDEFLQLHREEKIDLFDSLGSYAGAMGMPQFIPSSYRAYAVDFDDDGKRDLLHSTADVIGSVANYFAQHGWKRGQPVALRLRPDQIPTKVSDDMKPNIPLTRFTAKGVKLPEGAKPSDLGSLISLEQKNGMEHWLGLRNFYVITRYNHSNLYAMAVYQLSEKILEKMQDDDKHDH